MMDRKLTTCFPTNCKWSVYVAPKSPKVWLNFLIKVDLNRIKSATKFLYVQTSSSKVVAQPSPYPVVHRYWCV